MEEAEKNIQRQIERASHLLSRFGAACLRVPELGALLEKLRRLIERTDSLMVDSGVVEACSRCARVTGSCCFREMGQSYTDVQLLINGLLGCSFPQVAQYPGGCFFAGEKGCTLKARHAFCLNYFCPDLMNTPGTETVLEIQLQVGEQLLAGWELEFALGRFLTSHSIPAHL